MFFPPTSSSTLSEQGGVSEGPKNLTYVVCLSGKWETRWKESSWKEEEGSRGKWEHAAGEWFGHEHEDKGIRTTEDYRFYTLWSEFPEFTNKGKDLVLQVWPCFLVVSSWSYCFAPLLVLLLLVLLLCTVLACLGLAPVGVLQSFMIQNLGDSCH